MAAGYSCTRHLVKKVCNCFEPWFSFLNGSFSSTWTPCVTHITGLHLCFNVLDKYSWFLPPLGSIEKSSVTFCISNKPQWITSLKILDATHPTPQLINLFCLACWLYNDQWNILNAYIITSEKCTLHHVLCLNIKIGKQHSEHCIGCAVTSCASMYMPTENGVSVLLTGTATNMKKLYFTLLKPILLT